VLGLVLCAILAALPGCTKQGADILRVSGTITRGGQPVPDLMVHFVPGAGRPSWGQTDREGHYELHYVGKRMGALPGAHRVYVTLRQAAGSPDVLAGQAAPLSVDQKAIIAQYGTRQISPLTAQVDRDGQVIDFQLD
jgi:hypothetical protein